MKGKYEYYIYSDLSFQFLIYKVPFFLLSFFFCQLLNLLSSVLLFSSCFIPNIYAALCTAVLVPLICLVAVMVVFIHAYQVTEQWRAYDDIYRGRINSTGNKLFQHTHWCVQSSSPALSPLLNHQNKTQESWNQPLSMVFQRSKASVPRLSYPADLVRSLKSGDQNRVFLCFKQLFICDKEHGLSFQSRST